MANVLIVYASMSGNTEDIADLLKGVLESFHHKVDLKEMEYINAKEVLGYDGILIGSYTWGDGDLPYETEDFYNELDGMDLSGKKTAVFGSGDTMYPKFCGVVCLFEKRLSQCGAELVQEGLKMELSPETDGDVEECTNFAAAFAEKLGVS